MLAQFAVEFGINSTGNAPDLWLFLHTIAIAVYQAGFGQGTGPVLLYYMRCTGSESSLLNCSHIGDSYCLHSQDAGVVCPPCKL